MPAEITKSRSDGNASTTEERNRRGSERVVLRVPVELTVSRHGEETRLQVIPERFSAADLAALKDWTERATKTADTQRRALLIDVVCRRDAASLISGTS